MRLFRAALVMLPLFAAACGDDDKNGGDVAGVFPDEGFVGRTLRVEVTGDTTSWDAASTLNFGEGITVANIEVISPQSLQADLTIAPTTAVGAHDVTVTDGGSTFTLPGAFNLIAPVDVEPLLPLSQGGVTLYVITNLDLLHPFDTTQDENTGEFTAVSVTVGGTGLDAFVTDVTPSEITIQATADVDATTGPLTITSGTEVSPAGNVDVAARTAIPLVLGTPTTATLDNSALYEVDLATAQLLSLSVTSADENADVAYTLLPASGKWADVTSGFSSADNLVTAAGDKFYLSVLDLGLLSGYSYTISADGLALPATATAEVEPNETSAAATAGTGGVVHFTGALANDADVDFYKVTVTNGQTIRVVTTAGEGATDTQISIFNPNGNTLTKDANDEDIDGFDVGVGDDVTTTTLTPGTYFIKIEASAFAVFFGYAPVNDPYDAIIIVE